MGRLLRELREQLEDAEFTFRGSLFAETQGGLVQNLK
jgi:hypothetical protein